MTHAITEIMVEGEHDGETSLARVRFEEPVGLDEVERALSYEGTRQEKSIRVGRETDGIEDRVWDDERGITLATGVKNNDQSD